MTQPTERRFVMEPRLDAEVETINDALDLKANLTDPRFTDERVPTDNSVTSAKIANGAIVDADVNASAAIAKTKIDGTAVTLADTGTVTSTMIANATIVNADIADNTIESSRLAAQDYIQFDTTFAGGSTAAGMLSWDQDNETLEFMVDEHVTLQVGQEHLIRVKNNSGSVAIPERTVVMFAGAAGDTIKVTAAVSDGSVNVNYLAGITTEEIPADGFGFVTQLGFINQVNTNAWAVGTLLYVDPATPGGLTSTEPEAPAWTMPVAAVTKQNASSGRLLVRSIPGGSGAGGGASVNISDTAPAGGNAGDMWYDSTDGTLYVYYEDVDGSQWVQVQANSALTAGIESRVGALESQAVAFGALSPNYIINGGFDINQRSFTSSTTNDIFGFDRWQMKTAGGTTYSTQAFTAGSGPATGIEAANYARLVTTGQSGAGVVSLLCNKIEDVRAIAGKTVTVSFYAKAASGTPKIAVELEQAFGSGGSPSSTVLNYAGQATLSTSWARYSITVALPSLAGKTVGTTANTSFTQLNLWTSAGTDWNARTGSLGIQSNTFDIWGVQIEHGSTATAFRRNANSIQGELAACQRYYYRWTSLGTDEPCFCTGIQITSTTARMFFNMPVEMRTTPTSAYQSNMLLSDQTTASGVLSSFSLIRSTPKSVQFLIASSGLSFPTRIPVAFVTLTLGGYVEINAEL